MCTLFYGNLLQFIRLVFPLFFVILLLYLPTMLDLDKVKLFGFQDFRTNGHLWDAKFCNADSDKDGKTNGEELGDPNCTWVPGQAPEANAISHPGMTYLYISIHLWKRLLKFKKKKKFCFRIKCLCLVQAFVLYQFLCNL